MNKEFLSFEDLFDVIFLSIFGEVAFLIDKGPSDMWKDFILTLRQNINSGPLNTGIVDLNVYRYTLEVAVLKKKLWDPLLDLSWLRSVKTNPDCIGIPKNWQLRFAMIERFALVILKLYIEKNFRSGDIEAELFQRNCINFAKDGKFTICRENIKSIKSTLGEKSRFNVIQNDEREFLNFIKVEGFYSKIHQIECNIQAVIENKIGANLISAMNTFKNLKNFDDTLFLVDSEKEQPAIRLSPYGLDKRLITPTTTIDDSIHNSLIKRLLALNVWELLPYVVFSKVSLQSSPASQRDLYLKLKIPQEEKEGISRAITSLVTEYQITEAVIIYGLCSFAQSYRNRPEPLMPEELGQFFISFTKESITKKEGILWDDKKSKIETLLSFLNFFYYRKFDVIRKNSLGASMLAFFKVPIITLLEFSTNNRKDFVELIGNQQAFDYFKEEKKDLIKDRNFDWTVRLFLNFLRKPQSFYAFFQKKHSLIDSMIKSADVYYSTFRSVKDIEQFYLNDKTPDKEISDIVINRNIWELFTSYKHAVIDQEFYTKDVLGDELTFPLNPQDQNTPSFDFSIFTKLGTRANTEPKILKFLRHILRVSERLENCVRSIGPEHLWIETIFRNFIRNPERTMLITSEEMINLIREEGLQVNFFDDLFDNQRPFFNFLFENSDLIAEIMHELHSFPGGDDDKDRLDREYYDIGYKFSLEKVVGYGFEIFKEFLDKISDILEYLDSELEKHVAEQRAPIFFNEAFNKFILIPRGIEPMENPPSSPSSDSSRSEQPSVEMKDAEAKTLNDIEIE